MWILCFGWYIALRTGVIKYDMSDHASFGIYFIPPRMWRYKQPDFALHLLCELQKQQQCSLHCDTLLQTEGEKEGNCDRRREGIKYQVKLTYKTQSLKHSAFNRTLQKSRCITTTNIHSVSGWKMIDSIIFRFKWVNKMIEIIFNCNITWRFFKHISHHFSWFC